MPAVVVTGAAMGIGLGVAEKLVSEGMSVVALDRDREALERARTHVGERYFPLLGDIADWDSHERAAAAAESHGGLDGWVNNAGIDWVSAAHEATAEHIDRGLKVLLNGPMYGAAVAVRHMLPKRRGSIVNIASIQGVAAFPRYYVYDAAKAGVIMATKSIAVDYAPFGIRCNAVLPGTIETPMTYSTLPADLDRTEALRREGLLAPMLRVGQPSEMAEVVFFLLSDRASFVNGAEIIADGGAMARCFAYPQLNVDA